MTKESAAVKGCYLAQVHSGAEPGKIVYANCTIDNHVVGWRSPVNSAWYEYNNTDLSGKPISFEGTKLTADSAVLKRPARPRVGWAGPRRMQLCAQTALAFGASSGTSWHSYASILASGGMPLLSAALT